MRYMGSIQIVIGHPPENPDGSLLSGKLWSLKPMEHSKESFIQACKTDKSFSERWGLNIEERKLTDEERTKLYLEKTNTDTLFFPILRKTLDFHNIPKQEITVTYNNETIEVVR